MKQLAGGPLNGCRRRERERAEERGKEEGKEREGRGWKGEGGTHLVRQLAPVGG